MILSYTLFIQNLLVRTHLYSLKSNNSVENNDITIFDKKYYKIMFFACSTHYLNSIVIISLLIAFFSLIVSFITLYFGFFRKKRSLIGALAAYYESTKNDSTTVFEFAFSNTGNQELLVRDVIIDLVDGPDGFLLPIVKSDEIPMVLKGGQLALVKFDVSNNFLNRVKGFNYTLSFEFYVYSSKGKLYLAKKHILQTDDVNSESDCWKPFKLEKTKI